MGRGNIFCESCAMGFKMQWCYCLCDISTVNNMVEKGQFHMLCGEWY